MAVKTASVTGAWSAGATWGGTAPADGDSIIINEGVDVLMDADLSAWTGLLSVVINSSGTTPGQLTWKAGTSGYLKIRTGNSLSGSAGTNKGRIVCNNSGVFGETVPLPFADKAVIMLEGTANIEAVNLNIHQYHTEPAIQYAVTYGTLYPVTVSGSTFNGATLSNNTPVMIRSSGALPAPLEADYQYYVVATSGTTFQLSPVSGGVAVTLTSAGSGTIEVCTGAASGATALNVLTDVTGDPTWITTTNHNACVLVSENPAGYDQQRTTISTIAAGVITLANATDSVQRPGARIYLMSRNVSIQSSCTTSINIINAGTGEVLSEIRSKAGSGTTFYGTGLNFCTNCNPTGPISGCTTGLVSCTNCNPTGPISGCINGLSLCTNCNPTGPISGCNNGLQSCNNCNPTGSLSGNGADIRFDRYSTIRQRNKPTALTLVTRNGQGRYGRITYENYLGVPGAMKIIDNYGDITKVTCGSGAPVPATGPGGISGDCLECGTLQSFLGDGMGMEALKEVRIWVAAGTRTVTYRTINNFTGGLLAGGLRLSIDHINASGGISTVNVLSDALNTDTDWNQTIAATFTCLEGWITIQYLSLWQYELDKQVYIWPIPVIV